MLFDLTFPCYLTIFSGKECLSGKVICAYFVPLIEVLLYSTVPESRPSVKESMMDAAFGLFAVVVLPRLKVDPEEFKEARENLLGGGAPAEAKEEQPVIRRRS
jgi:hypothetical protein